MNKKTAKMYDYLSYIYPIIDIFLWRQKKTLINIINKFPDGKLLEVGVGNGSIINLYKKHSITAIDISHKMLQRAANSHPPKGVFYQMDGENLSFSASSFDYVVLSHVIAVTKNPSMLFKEIKRVLKPHGKVFILNHFTPDNSIKHLDIIFNKISYLFCFRSLIYERHFWSMHDFQVKSRITLGIFQYFKIIILEKDENL